MRTYINRAATHTLRQKIAHNPVTAIIGPRQCGKSTLAKIITEKKNCIWLDLEKPSDIRVLSDAEVFFRMNRESLIRLPFYPLTILKA